MHNADFVTSLPVCSAYAGSCPFKRTGKIREKGTFEAVFDTIKGHSIIVWYLQFVYFWTDLECQQNDKKKIR
jgi:hypothetical protein